MIYICQISLFAGPIFLMMKMITKKTKVKDPRDSTFPFQDNTNDSSMAGTHSPIQLTWGLTLLQFTLVLTILLSTLDPMSPPFILARTCQSLTFLPMFPPFMCDRMFPQCILVLLCQSSMQETISLLFMCRHHPPSTTDHQL